MPTPQPSYSDFDSAYSFYSKADHFLPEQGYTINVQDDDDSYWNSYGDNDDTDQPPISATGKNDAGLSSEDAYWAQYSSVQGSGDSTLPSPRPEKHNFNSADIPQRIIIPSDDLQTNRNEPYNPLEPPSPEKLAERLAALSDRSDSPTFPDDEDSPTTESDSNSPQLMRIDSTHSRSSACSVSPRQVSDNYDLLDYPSNDASPEQQQNPRDALLKENVASLFKLWRLTDSSTDSNDQSKQAFLAAVRAAIDDI